LRKLWSTVMRGRVTHGKRPAYSSVLDLGTEQVKALVLELQEGECIVVGVGRAFCEQHDTRAHGAVVDLPALARSCDRALREAEDMTERYSGRQVVPDWAVVGLPNHVTTAQTLSVTNQRSNPQKRVSDRELTDVLKRAQRLALRQLARRIRHIQRAEQEEVELLETSVADIQIDGRRVTTPLGFRGQRLTVSVSNVVVSSSYLRAIEAMTEELGLELLATASGWQALASILSEKEGICIDVGGMASDIVVVRNGKAWATASIPAGGRHFTKHLAETLGLPWREAETLKLAYSRGRVQMPGEDDVRAAMSRVLDAWVGAVEATLKRLCGPASLPHRFYLCGGGSSLPGIVDTLRSHPWMERLDFSRHPEVQLMQPWEIATVLDRTGQLADRRHISPMAVASYVMSGDSKADPLGRVLWAVKRPSIFAGRGGNA